MSSAVASPLEKAAGFYQAPIGKKVVMAMTGAILFAYVVAHMFGNLQIYSPDRQQINQYAAFLHDPTHAYFLWGARIILLVAVVLHILAAFQLWRQNRSARPVGYFKKDDVPAAYAARTMVWSGPIIAAFVIFHVLHLTTGSVVPLKELGPYRPDVRANVIDGFQHPVIAAVYIFAMILLCLHLFHGVWSMFQSVGVSHPRYSLWLKRFAMISALVIALANISIPVAVLAGVLAN